MLAGVTRLTEVCFVAPSYTPADGVEDNRSDHTLADGTGAEAASASTKGRTFRHLPPFVSSQARSRFIILYPSPLPFTSLSLSLSFFKTECRRDEITVAFSGRGPIVYVRDRRRTAIRPRKRDGPCDIHPYHVQVRFFFVCLRLGSPSTFHPRPPPAPFCFRFDSNAYNTASHSCYTRTSSSWSRYTPRQGAMHPTRRR